MRILAISVMLAVACGRYGFDPQRRGPGDASEDAAGDAAGDAAPDGPSAFCPWLASCNSGAFTCCDGAMRTCVQNVQQCASGNVSQCDTNPPYTPCGGGEICCIIAPETYPRCVVFTGQC